MIESFENINWHSFYFHSPVYFLLILIIPLYLIWNHKVKNANYGPALRVSNIEAFKKDTKPSRKLKWLNRLPYIFSIAWLFLTFALARPRISNLNQEIDANGLDIVLALDVSGSMLAEDFTPNRLDAARATAIKFINERPSDRIGLVVFAGESFTQCPVTIDHSILKEQLSAINIMNMSPGTAIGMGLATSVDRLRKTTGKSKIVILMTDGVNNAGIAPQTALSLAQTYKIKVYCIGIGTIGEALTPALAPNGKDIIKKMMPVTIDEPLLKEIANGTGGKYFRATDNQSLQLIYNEIDNLEKSKSQVNSKRHYTELFWPLGMGAFAFLLLYFLVKYKYSKNIF